MICSNDNLLFAEVNKLRSLFHANSYTNNFFYKILKQFLDSFSCVTTNCDDDSYKHFVKVPYVDADSKRFVKQLSELVKCKFGVEIQIYSDSDLFIHTKFKHFTDKYKKNGRQRKDHTAISVSCHPPLRFVQFIQHIKLAVVFN